MGLFDRLTGGSDESSTPDDDEDEEEEVPIDHWELMYRRQGGNWSVADVDGLQVDVSDLRNPLDKESVKRTAETEGWAAGMYSMRGRRENGTMAETEWTFEFEPEVEETSEIDQLRRELTQLRKEMQNGTGGIGSIEDAYADLYQRALQDGDIQGAQAALSMWREETKDPPEDLDAMVARVAHQEFQSGNTSQAAQIIQAHKADQAAQSGGNNMMADMIQAGDGVEVNSMLGMAMAQMVADPEYGKQVGRGLSGVFEGMVDAADSASEAQEAMAGQGVDFVLNSLADMDGGQEEQTEDQPDPAPEPAPAPTPDPSPDPAPDPGTEDSGSALGDLGDDLAERAEQARQEERAEEPAEPDVEPETPDDGSSLQEAGDPDAEPETETTAVGPDVESVSPDPAPAGMGDTTNPDADPMTASPEDGPEHVENGAETDAPDEDTAVEDAQDETDDGKVPIPESEAGLEDLNYQEMVSVASRVGHPSGGSGVKADDLEDWLRAELFGDGAPDDDGDGEDDEEEIEFEDDDENDLGFEVDGSEVHDGIEALNEVKQGEVPEEAQ